MRHTFNIVVAMLSMAAGAWQGTTAHTEQPGSTTRQEQGSKPARQLTLRGCVQKGQAAGSFVLISAGPATETALEPAASPSAEALPESENSTEASDGRANPRKITYELVADKPDVDLTAAVGRQVEAKGLPERTAPGATADDSPTAIAAAADSPSADSPAGTSGEGPGRSRVRVTAIRPVGGRCE